MPTRLVDEIGGRGGHDPFWTFGGGTVLMLRSSIAGARTWTFLVTDPQHLGC